MTPSCEVCGRFDEKTAKQYVAECQAIYAERDRLRAERDAARAELQVFKDKQATDEKMAAAINRVTAELMEIPPEELRRQIEARGEPPQWAKEFEASVFIQDYAHSLLAELAALRAEIAAGVVVTDTFGGGRHWWEGTRVSSSTRRALLIRIEKIE